MIKHIIEGMFLWSKFILVSWVMITLFLLAMYGVVELHIRGVRGVFLRGVYWLVAISFLAWTVYSCIWVVALLAERQDLLHGVLFWPGLVALIALLGGLDMLVERILG